MSMLEESLDSIDGVLDVGILVVAVYSSFKNEPWSNGDNRAIFNAKLAKV